MKEVIILGSGPSRVKCPWDSEVWAVNNAYRQWKGERKVPNKTFIVHKQVWHGSEAVFDWEDMKEWCGEIVSLWEIPVECKPYPYEKVFNFSRYMTNTICYMIAYAIFEEYEKIRFYGCDMHEGGEYYLEKAGVEFWIGVAMGRGIEIEITPGSTLLQTAVGIPYGTRDDYDAELAMGRKAVVRLGLVEACTKDIKQEVDKKYVRYKWG